MEDVLYKLLENSPVLALLGFVLWMVLGRMSNHLEGLIKEMQKSREDLGEELIELRRDFKAHTEEDKRMFETISDTLKEICRELRERVRN